LSQQLAQGGFSNNQHQAHRQHARQDKAMPTIKSLRFRIALIG
jgi:hypothetical protein